MKKKLKSLDQANSEAWDNHKMRGTPNGIACPKCGEELLDNGIIYTSSPSQSGILCSKCDYEGRRMG